MARNAGHERGSNLSRPSPRGSSGMWYPINPTCYLGSPLVKGCEGYRQREAVGQHSNEPPSPLSHMENNSWTSFQRSPRSAVLPMSLSSKHAILSDDLTQRPAQCVMAPRLPLFSFFLPFFFLKIVSQDVFEFFTLNEHG